jgi:hypothetical protein
MHVNLREVSMVHMFKPWTTKTRTDCTSVYLRGPQGEGAQKAVAGRTAQFLCCYSAASLGKYHATEPDEGAILFAILIIATGNLYPSLSSSHIITT